MNHETLLVEFGPDLAFRFEKLPATVAAPLKDVLSAFIVDQLDTKPIVIPATCGSGFSRDPEARLITTRDAVAVYQHNSTTHFESPGIRAWCNTGTESAGVELIDATPAIARHFTSLALISIVLELALARGWFGMHAAAVAIDGRGILLPGDSGVGKSTIYRNAAAAGFDTLSGDLVWLREAPEHVEIRPLPRGSLDADAPEPSIHKAIMSAIVCPTIVDADDNRLEPISVPHLMQTVVRQGGFLSPAQNAKRFTMLTRIARSAPGYRLAAGRKQNAVPALLRSLLAQ